MPPRLAHPLIAIALLAACTPAPDVPSATPTAQPIAQPDTAIDGDCTARTAPALTTQMITQQVEVVPAVIADDGTVTSPAIFRDEIRPVTVAVDDGRLFATLCPEELSAERVATLQRALKARLAYDGPITGTYDARTQAAVQAFQAPQGFDSPQIARAVAQSLGLVPFGGEATNAFQ